MRTGLLAALLITRTIANESSGRNLSLQRQHFSRRTQENQIEEVDPQVQGCINFLLPQRRVDRNEFMDYFLKEATMDVIHKQNITWNVKVLRDRMLDPDGNYFSNYTSSMPPYTVLTTDVLNVFIEKACRFRVDDKKVKKYCRNDNKNVTAIPRDLTIRLGTIESDSRRKKAVKTTCSEVFDEWKNSIENVLEFYTHVGLVASYPTPSPTTSPTESPTESPTRYTTASPPESLTRSPTKITTQRPTILPTLAPSKERSTYNVSIPAFVLSLNVGVAKADMDNSQLVAATATKLSQEFQQRSDEEKEFVSLDLFSLDQVQERRSRVLRRLQDESAYVARMGGTAYYYESAPNEAEVKDVIEETLNNPAYVQLLRSSDNAAMRSVKGVQIHFDGENIDQVDGDNAPNKKKQIGNTLGWIVFSIVLLIIAISLCRYFHGKQCCSRSKNMMHQELK